MTVDRILLYISYSYDNPGRIDTPSLIVCCSEPMCLDLTHPPISRLPGRDGRTGYHLPTGMPAENVVG